ncbi:PAAR-like protein [Chryseobacterium sp. T16E-39]|uniref:PAAR-like protein n=1 Tax=Chryseobacterium sp. T16E-39 TaxID=2015076 RepID=UPI001E339872|nr:PAAR-like protein [Chryseobacterium sp. T16E-39]
MSAPIPYTVQSGETLQDIAKKLGIKDWTELKNYHNQNAGPDQKVPNVPYAGFNLLTPSQEEIYKMNGETPPPDPSEEQKSAEQKQGEEKKKEEEEKKEEKASKSDHDGKYFVVHNAKCVCDKAENPKQTADLQVTTHKIIVLNDDSTKLAATEEDKTFNPPVATFGKCTLKPSAAGNLPCALAAAPKWSKTYDSTQVMGKNTLTEISELQCMVGGKITIDKHGQIDSVSNAHADNTNPVELAMVNPAIAQPKKKEEYPVVTSISLTKIEDRKDFKEVDSKKKEIIYLRKNEEADFKANLKSGNKQLTSWMVYSDHQGKKDNRLFLKEQIGTEFSQSFADLGKFRVEGYGKPKSPEFEKGKYDKCDPSCSIDIEVIENTLLDIECTSGDFSTRIDPSKNRKFRRGVPSVFKAKFFIPDLTEEEKSRLTLSLLDGDGNIVTDGVQNGDILTFTPQNTKAKYTIVAKYTNDNGEVIEKQMSGETEGNAVIGISHGAEVVRPGTAMSFSVSKMKYNFGTNNPVYDLTSDESSEVKWNLNGVLQGTGKSITIPGNQLMAPGKYVVEAYSKVANATGKGAKDEEDDWRFEVKNNIVTEIKYDKKPKVGVNIVFEISKMLIKDYDAAKDGAIVWKITGPITATGTGEKLSYKFSAPGKYTINCSMGGRNCEKPLSIDVIQPKITVETAKWMDNDGSSGNIIKEAGYGQEISAYVRYEGLQGEDVKLEVYDNDSTGSNIIFEKSGVLNDTATAVYWPFTLDDSIKQKIQSKGVTKKGELFFKMKSTNSSLIIQNSDKALASSLIVSDVPKIVDAYFCDASDTEKRYNSPIATPLYFKIYAINMVDKNVEVQFITKSDMYFSIAWNPKQWKDWKDVKDKFAKEIFFDKKEGKINKKGELILKVDPSKLGKPKNYFKISAIIKVTEGEGKEAKEKAMYLDHSDMAILYATATLPNMVENKGAVKVGRETLSTGKNDDDGICEAEARVRAFMRMLRKGEGTEGEKGYTTQYSGKQFTDLSKHPEEVITAGNYSSSAAGAYQIMRYTWWWVNGEKLTKENKKAGVYEDAHDYIKKYQISSFNQESQDETCIILFKYKQSRKFLDLIVANKPQEAMEKYGSYEWASLPPGRYGQPTQTMEGALAEYERCLKEELKGISNLHIKKGFLKKFGYDCCELEKIVVGDINKYKIEVDKFTYPKIMKNETSKKYQYDIYENGQLIKTITLEKNEHGLLPFPETGPNWGRFGTRDSGGDNWVDEKVCAALLGFFYSLPKNNYTDSLYFNDISANDGRNIGHSGHNISGNDIDIRYPGSSNAGQTLWSDAKKAYPSEEKFIEALENILSVGVKWGFNKNYAYKKDIKHTTGKATSVHQDHFHLGLR